MGILLDSGLSMRQVVHRGDLEEVAGAAGRAMESQAVFWGFGPGRCQGVAARDSGEVGFDVADFVEGWVRLIWATHFRQGSFAPKHKNTRAGFVAGLGWQAARHGNGCRLSSYPFRNVCNSTSVSFGALS
jgi:hypothetical protein